MNSICICKIFYASIWFVFVVFFLYLQKGIHKLETTPRNDDDPSSLCQFVTINNGLLFVKNDIFRYLVLHTVNYWDNGNILGKNKAKESRILLSFLHKQYSMDVKAQGESALILITFFSTGCNKNCYSVSKGGLIVRRMT